MTWEYEKYNPETGKVEHCPTNDDDGSITGAVRIGLKAWFDENPEIRIAQGWIKHIHYSTKDDPDVYPDYNPQTHFITVTAVQVDEYTIEDTYHVTEKSEELLALEELLNVSNAGRSGIVFTVG